jgi:hypothetical protein
MRRPARSHLTTKLAAPDAPYEAREPLPSA